MISRVLSGRLSKFSENHILTESGVDSEQGEDVLIRS